MITLKNKLLINPKGIALSGNNLLVANSHDFRRISIDSGDVTTISGGLNNYSDGPGDQARFDSPEGIVLVDFELYVADTQTTL